MRTPSRFALLLLVSGLAFGIHVQDSAKANVLNNWRSQAVVDIRGVRAGTSTWMHLNTSCYDYEVTASQVATMERTADFLKFFSGRSGRAQEDMPHLRARFTWPV